MWTFPDILDDIFEAKHDERDIHCQKRDFLKYTQLGRALEMSQVLRPLALCVFALFVLFGTCDGIHLDQDGKYHHAKKDSYYIHMYQIIDILFSLPLIFLVGKVMF